MFDVPSGVSLSTHATSRARALGRARAETGVRTTAQCDECADEGRNAGFPGTNAGLTGVGRPANSVRRARADVLEAPSDPPSCEAEDDRTAIAKPAGTTSAATRTRATITLRAPEDALVFTRRTSAPLDPWSWERAY